MKIATTEAVADWCRERGHTLSQYGDVRFHAVKAWSVPVPTEYIRIIVFLDCLLSQEASRGFIGALLFVQEWTVWSETATVDLFDRLRASMSRDTCKLADAPASIFGDDELIAWLRESKLEVTERTREVMPKQN